MPKKIANNTTDEEMAKLIMEEGIDTAKLPQMGGKRRKASKEKKTVCKKKTKK